ncbi:MAG: hypothetical protein JXA95_12590 [Spirochaetales bacterium]|nr:hypothetical protein [Spirochaetales bacterium]
MDQDRILGYALQCLRDKAASWFPGESVEIYRGEAGEGIRIFVTGLEEEHTANPHETCRITTEKGDFQVPRPRMVTLKLALVSCFGDPVKALDGAARIKRNIHDDPYLALEKCLWHGCRDARTVMEFVPFSQPLPGAYTAFESYRWELSLRLGINSVREEKIVKVRERQFTAVSK